MRLLKEVNLIDNKKLIFWINSMSIILLILFALIFWIFTLMFSPTRTLPFNIAYFFFMTPLLLIFIIFAHEGIHGLFFKLFKPKSEVRFGFKNGMFYATSPNSYYSKYKFICISLAPFIIITVSLIISYFLGLLSQPLFILLTSVHGAGCIGDFYWIWLLLKSPRNTIVEDTEIGICLYV
ncbi:DUF3267 domain-containing protein [Listeria booriae]|uniref:DUF3267 domain-containing protein n=1 Tax=Listeria booriae TaxID=1552123 RepID=UPI00162454D4|nr:DUF3267 domain-containing protein [Listeria booriae]MBC2187740.1 DUF3267 domain-containing protein [Listeria booriae]